MSAEDSVLSDKKARARQVFGEAVDDEPGISLTYSPSPSRRHNNPVDSSFSLSSDGPFSSTSSVSRNTDSSQTGLERSHLRGGPFDKLIQDSPDAKGKENEQSVDESMMSSDQSTISSEKSTISAQHQVRPRARAPLRRDLVKKTQDAINKASASINQSLNAARIAKQESFRYRSQQTAKAKREWEEEKASAEAFHKQAEKSRHENLALRRQLSARNGKAKALRHLEGLQVAIRNVDKESQFKSSVYREHHEMLRQAEERRRRESVASRHKLRQNHRVGEERMKLQRIEEDQAVFEERHAANIAQRNAISDYAESRRKSFAFRVGDARRIRNIHKQMEAQRLAGEHESYELKWDGERDAEETRRRMEQERRESLAARGEEHRDQREAVRLAAERDAAAQHESYELKWSGEDDASAYMKQMEQERRESFAARNKEGLRRRMEESERKIKELAEEHSSFELKWAGEKDAVEYQRHLEQQRRESLAFRNKEGRNQRVEASNRRSDELSAEHESFELKRAGERDVDDYKRAMAGERRTSLQGRGAHARKQRQEADMHASELRRQEHASYQLKWEGERDAEAYRRDLEKQRRQSLAGRNRELVNHAKTMKELQDIAREKETESLVLKWAGENDAKDYLARLEEERRRSLVERGKQVLHHRQVEDDMRADELQQKHDDESWKAGDHQDVTEYRKSCEERDRASLQYRRKEAHIQRLEQLDREYKQREQDDENAELETQARADVEEYLKSCRRRRRMSLAFRARETRRHVKWRRQKAHADVESTRREVQNRRMDARYVELAQHQERARHAMDALRHAGCSFN